MECEFISLERLAEIDKLALEIMTANVSECTCRRLYQAGSTDLTGPGVSSLPVRKLRYVAD
jgi:hypothetical protein